VRVVDAPPCDVGEWSITDALSKRLEEMPAAQLCGASKVNDLNSGANVGRREDSFPRGETIPGELFAGDQLAAKSNETVHLGRRIEVGCYPCSDIGVVCRFLHHPSPGLASALHCGEKSCWRQK